MDAFSSELIFRPALKQYIEVDLCSFFRLLKMAEHRPRVSPKIKEALLLQSGGKCANPGCSAHRTHFHHIKEWHAYRTHDARDMIAICPNCHDAVHHGVLKITDETLYRWKRIQRQPANRGHLYIEPRKGPIIELGTNMLFGPPDGFFAFNLSPRNRWAIRIVNEDILLVSFSMSTLSGREILRFQDNHWEQDSADLVKFVQVPGHLRMTTKAREEFLPDWVSAGVRQVDPTYATEEEILLLDIEVLEPGMVRVQGVWVDDHIAIVATSKALFFTGERRDQKPLNAGTLVRCAVDLSQNGVVSPTLFRVSFPDRDPERFTVTIGYR